MDAETGRTASFIARRLETKPKDFAFFQTLRLMRFACLREGKGDEQLFDIFRRHIRVRPLLSLAFPPVDVNALESLAPLPDATESLRKADASTLPLWKLTVTFLGLYGASTPLPTYYTEDLLAEQSAGSTVNRDMVDIINQPFYELLWLCWRRYRLPLRIIEEKDDDCFRRLWALGGRDPELLAKNPIETGQTLRRLALYAQHPRSAQSLTALLRDVLKVGPVRVRPFATRKVTLPADQRCSMGMANSRLGEDCVLGDRIEDNKSCFDLDIGPIDMNTYRSLLPGRGAYGKLCWYTRDYLDQPLDFKLNLVVKADELRPAQLHADQWGCLGEDMWLRAEFDDSDEAHNSPEKQDDSVVSFFIAHEGTPNQPHDRPLA